MKKKDTKLKVNSKSKNNDINKIRNKKNLKVDKNANNKENKQKNNKFFKVLNENNYCRNILDGKKKFVFILLLFIIIYAIYMIVKVTSNPIDTFLVEKGTLYMEESLTGYIIREETVIEGDDYKNGIVPIKAEGERVAKGDAVFRYYSKDEEQTKKKIEELDKEIQTALSKENTLFSSDIKLLDTQIEGKLDEIYEINDIQKINEYKSEISNYITKKAKITGDLSPAGSYIKKLITERNSYEKILNNDSKYVNAENSGVVSYKVDGFESVLRTSDFSKLNKGFLSNLNIKTNQIIASSNEKGKIINNYDAYIACITNSEKAKEAKSGDNVKIRLQNGKEVYATIEYTNIEGNDTVVVLKTSKYVEELISYRKISFDLIWWSANGLKVPNSAILYDGDLTFVVRERAGYMEKIFVKILKQNDKYSIVSNYLSKELEEKGFDMTKMSSKKSINLHDEILINIKEDKLKDIK